MRFGKHEQIIRLTNRIRRIHEHYNLIISLITRTFFGELMPIRWEKHTHVEIYNNIAITRRRKLKIGWKWCKSDDEREEKHFVDESLCGRRCVLQRDDRLVRDFALQDLQVVEEQNAQYADQHGGTNQALGLNAVLDQVPDQQHDRNQEQDGADHSIETLQLENGQVEEVEEKEHDVDDQNHEVETGRKAQTALAEAVFASVPLVTQQRADDDADDDLQDLDDAAVSSQIASVDSCHCFTLSCRRIDEWSSWDAREFAKM